MISRHPRELEDGGFRCGHEWLPRSEDTPRVCPKCKSPYWDKPRAEKPASKKKKSRAE